MTSFMRRSARQFMLIRAAREIRQEIEKAGLDNLKALADTGQSIVGTYLNGCSPQEKARVKRDFNTLLQMEITIEMVLDEVTRQNPDLGLIMEAKEDYKKTETQNLQRFLKADVS